MTTEEKDWFLSLPKEIKLDLISSMLNKNQTGMAIQAMTILLEAPIKYGGVSTEEIDDVFQTYIKS